MSCAAPTINRPEVAPGSHEMKERKRKEAPPPPPASIYDMKTGRSYTRDKLIGKGGFAYVYRVIDNSTNESLACKVIHKSTLVRSKARRKLQSEIGIHESMVHENIVGFRHHFEDKENVYMILELCQCQSLMELHRRWGPLTEEEVRYYLVQILDAVEHMHSRSIIHRDIKLGNLMLSHKMEVKVGDFGLAAAMDKTGGTRRTTICGTPNYIAPEIINPDTQGHSFEVDTWAIGVVVFTLLVGKPPFETKSVKSTYSKIRANEYSFPESVGVSQAARDLVSKLLHPQPFRRPLLHEVRTHEFVTGGYLPTSLAPETRKKRPTFASQRVGGGLRPKEMIDPAMPVARRPLSLLNRGSNPGVNVKDAKAKAGPAPLYTATSNLNVAPRRPQEGVGEARKLRRQETMRPRAAARADVPRGSAHARMRGMERPDDAPNCAGGAGRGGRVSSLSCNERVPPPASPEDAGRDAEKEGGRQCKAGGSNPHALSTAPCTHGPVFKMESLARRLPSIDVGPGQTGAGAFLVETETRPNLLWITKWVDYSNKYGFGYQLADGSIGVSFNDRTRMVCLNNKAQYTEANGQCEDFSFDRAPQIYGKKVTILKYFKSYMHKNLLDSGASISKRDRSSITANAPAERVEMVNLQYWYRRKDAIVFHMTNYGVQINFTDHTKLILCPKSHTLTFIDKQRSHHAFNWKDVLACEDLSHPVMRRLPVVDEVLKIDAELTRGPHSKPATSSVPEKSGYYI